MTMDAGGMTVTDRLEISDLRGHLGKNGSVSDHSRAYQALMEAVPDEEACGVLAADPTQDQGPDARSKERGKMTVSNQLMNLVDCKALSSSPVRRPSIRHPWQGMEAQAPRPLLFFQGIVFI